MGCYGQPLVASHLPPAADWPVLRRIFKVLQISWNLALLSFLDAEHDKIIHVGQKLFLGPKNGFLVLYRELGSMRDYVGPLESSYGVVEGSNQFLIWWPITNPNLTSRGPSNLNLVRGGGNLPPPLALRPMAKVEPYKGLRYFILKLTSFRTIRFATLKNKIV